MSAFPRFFVSENTKNSRKLPKERKNESKKIIVISAKSCNGIYAFHSIFVFIRTDKMEGPLISKAPCFFACIHSRICARIQLSAKEKA